MKVKVINPDCLAHSDPRYQCCAIKENDICKVRKHDPYSRTFQFEVYVPEENGDTSWYMCPMTDEDVEIIEG